MAMSNPHDGVWAEVQFLGNEAVGAAGFAEHLYGARHTVRALRPGPGTPAPAQGQDDPKHAPCLPRLQFDPSLHVCW